MIADTRRGVGTLRSGWLAAGVLLLIYAVAGNWLVLPGYRRFLEHGSSGGASGPGFVWGAARTILWMLSFHLGAFCLAIAALSAQGPGISRFRRWFAALAVIWIVLWSIPHLPGPYTAFFAAVGIFILGAMVASFTRATMDGADAFAAGAHWRIASTFFFALATWDMCGLGSVGGILHPEGDVRQASQALLVAQTTKLIIELAIAWALLAVAAWRRPPRSV